MAIPAVVGVIGAIGSGIAQKSAAKKAANAQSRAADAQIAEYRRQFDEVQKLLKPYVEAGNTGLGAFMSLVGLGGRDAVAPAIETVQVPGQFGRRGTTQYKVNGQTFATEAEAKAYAEANKTGAISAQDAQQAEIDKITNGAQFGELTRQGEYALQANAASTGGLRGGDTQAALAQFRPALLQSLIDKQLSLYGGLAATGQDAAARTGSAALTTGAQVGQAFGDRGAAQAGAAIAGGNAWQSVLGGLNQTLGAFGGGNRFGNSPAFDGFFGGPGLGNFF